MLAVIDMRTKTVDDIEIFFDTFNKALADYLEEPEYIWDPYLIMMDHKRANFEALERVYGPDFRKAKTVTCQWHFLHCAEKYIMKLSEDERQTFRGWCAALMEAHTKTEYKKIAELIKNFTAKQDFLPWWKWWAPRCPHLVPAIWGFNLPKVNMAEIGQSKLKQDKVLWLLQAVKYDMVEFHFQAVKYNKFVSNREKVTGRGPTMKKRNEHEHEEERQFVDQFCEVILHGDLLDEVKDQNAKDFMPSVRAKHKAPKNMNIGIQEHPPKKSNTKRVGKKMPDRIGKGFNPCYNTGVDKERNNEQICQQVNDEMLVPENMKKIL